MKRRILYFTAALAVLAMGACTCKTDKAECTGATCDKCDKDVVYTGVLPAADADGVRYTLLLDYDKDRKGGDYDLIQTYFASDSTGVVDLASFATEGDFTVTDQNGKQGIKLVSESNEEMYFLTETDSTIVMTDASYTAPDTPGMNYTLKAVK